MDEKRYEVLAFEGDTAAEVFQKVADNLRSRGKDWEKWACRIIAFSYNYDREYDRHDVVMVIGEYPNAL